MDWSSQSKLINRCSSSAEDTRARFFLFFNQSLHQKSMVNIIWSDRLWRVIHQLGADPKWPHFPNIYGFSNCRSLRQKPHPKTCLTLHMMELESHICNVNAMSQASRRAAAAKGKFQPNFFIIAVHCCSSMTAVSATLPTRSYPSDHSR